MGQFAFPVVAFSPRGWRKTAEYLDELVDAAPSDYLRNWQGLTIYDSAGRRYVARRAYRAWPKSRLGAYLCRLFRHSVYVEFDLAEPKYVPLDELKARVLLTHGSDSQVEAANN